MYLQMISMWEMSELECATWS